MSEDNAAAQHRTDRAGQEIGSRNKTKNLVHFQNKTSLLKEVRVQSKSDRNTFYEFICEYEITNNVVPGRTHIQCHPGVGKHC